MIRLDSQHELIAKGCTAEQKEDGTEEQNLNTRVQLPWTKDLETIQGVIYYCTGDFCNGARELSIAVPLLVKLNQSFPVENCLTYIIQNFKLLSQLMHTVSCMQCLMFNR
ncbi:hypothetical protein Tsp_07878 [Trichinella spiralis]|uniref:hypothetical protein n=1 Tax=Trichinella spiralis TaxID=6334 RepID=UPI0001EFB279|nr:hypothetical protein Tsp_07878 [Trichinella spiralis]